MFDSPIVLAFPYQHYTNDRIASSVVIGYSLNNHQSEELQKVDAVVHRKFDLTRIREDRVSFDLVCLSLNLPPEVRREAKRVFACCRLLIESAHEEALVELLVSRRHPVKKELPGRKEVSLSVNLN